MNTRSDLPGGSMPECRDCRGPLVFERQPLKGTTTERCEDCGRMYAIRPRLVASPESIAKAAPELRGERTKAVLAILPKSERKAVAAEEIAEQTGIPLYLVYNILGGMKRRGSVHGLTKKVARLGRKDRMLYWKAA